jgi:SAM-dependent methyltransferase
MLSRVPRDWIAIHAGFNDSGANLPLVLPGSHGDSLDIFDPIEMPEPSIARARHLTGVPVTSRAADWKALPVPDAACDAVFLLFSAHELRRRESRIHLFEEAARILRPGGEVILLEHLRDFSNFAAFGPGVLHFFSASSWHDVSRSAGFNIADESDINPFVRAFVFRRQS